ncbi:hypothetical protein P153DRAFT_263401, partial [Dothidotthia symphoricarpi CBS 119687]
MVRRSAGFVSKRAHRKSRGGCLTCKRKKVKCDEDQPACGYCSLRRLNCEYPQEALSNAPLSVSSSSSSPSSKASPKSTSPFDAVDFNEFSIQSWLVPVVHTSSGYLSSIDLELLHHYKTATWRCLPAREDESVGIVHRELVPQMSLSKNYLLYAVLSMAASHSNSLRPRKDLEKQALIYRQKTFSAYTQALQDITTENYESVILTGTFLLSLVPLPESSTSEEYLDWMYTILKMSEGLRILASLRWSAGIEKLSIYPLILRELRTLPPPPNMNTSSHHTQAGPVGATPDHPNPASTYFFTHPNSAPLFLPPSLMALLAPNSEHHDILVPVFHALSPIFLSLYYYHLSPDFFVRIHVFCSFLMPDFLKLVKDKEPKALVLVAWWFALAGWTPKGWWVGEPVRQVVGAVGRRVRREGEELLSEAIEGAERIVEIFDREGREKAAETVFGGWEGVDWNEGPVRADEWDMRLFEDPD